MVGGGTAGGCGDWVCTCMHAPDWLVALHEGEAEAPHPAFQTNLVGMLEGWREWPLGMDFLNPASSNHAWKGLMSRLYEDAIERILGRFPGGRVLDLACGPGTTTLLAAQHARSVQALDFSQGMIEALRKNTEALENVSSVVGDGQRLSFDNAKFSVVFSMFGLMFFRIRLRACVKFIVSCGPVGGSSSPVGFRSWSRR